MTNLSMTLRAYLEAQEELLNSALDEPWNYEGNETDEELWDELLEVEAALGSSLWPLCA